MPEYGLNTNLYCEECIDRHIGQGLLVCLPYDACEYCGSNTAKHTEECIKAQLDVATSGWKQEQERADYLRQQGFELEAELARVKSKVREDRKSYHKSIAVAVEDEFCRAVKSMIPLVNTHGLKLVRRKSK